MPTNMPQHQDVGIIAKSNSDIKKALQVLASMFPREQAVLGLLTKKNLGSGFQLFVRYRIIRSTLECLGLTLNSDGIVFAHGEIRATIDPTTIVGTWAGVSSLKSYRNNLKALGKVEKKASIAGSVVDPYIHHTLLNLMAELTDIEKTLDDAVPVNGYPAGFQIAWPELKRAAD